MADGFGDKRLAIPKLGFGLYGTDWQLVRKMMEGILKDARINILICVFDPRDVRRRKGTFSKLADCWDHGSMADLLFSAE